MIIEVKSIKCIFDEVWAGRKYSELRFDDDKDYKIGAILVQNEWLKNKKAYTGRKVSMSICGITRVNHWIADTDYRWVVIHLDPKTFYKLNKDNFVCKDCGCVMNRDVDYCSECRPFKNQTLNTN